MEQRRLAAFRVQVLGDDLRSSCVVAQTTLSQMLLPSGSMSVGVPPLGLSFSWYQTGFFSPSTMFVTSVLRIQSAFYTQRYLLDRRRQQRALGERAEPHDDESLDERRRRHCIA